MGNCIGRNKNKKKKGAGKDDDGHDEDDRYDNATGREKKKQKIDDKNFKEEKVINGSGKTKGNNSKQGQGEALCKLVKIKPVEEEDNWQSGKGSGAFERKLIRLILPYLPKRQWAQLRLVNTTWCSVIDGEWARMHTLHLTEVLPKGPDTQKGIRHQKRALADHVSAKCQLSKGIICAPSKYEDAVDLSDDEFWYRLTPRTQDLQTLKLHNVILPKSFFIDFLPRCKNLQVLEIVQKNRSSGQDTGPGWTDADRRGLRSAIGGLKNLQRVHLRLHTDHLGDENEEARLKSSLPAGCKVELTDRTTTTSRPNIQEQDIENALQNGDGATFKKYIRDNIPMTANILSSLSRRCPDVTRLSFDLTSGHLNQLQHNDCLRKAFSTFRNLHTLRINCADANDGVSRETVYRILQTVATVLNTVAEHAPGLHTLKLVRLPDPMSIDKPLATEFGTAFVKLNAETALHTLHVCVSAPTEMFHVWSLPWPALTKLQSLTLTDTNAYPERSRGIDLESMPNLQQVTLCTDSLDDEMASRIFALPHTGIVELTLEPGPKGLGKRGLATVAVACVSMQKLTISFSRAKGANLPDASAWAAIFRAAYANRALKRLVLVDLDERYIDKVVAPVGANYPEIGLRPVYERAHFDTYAEAASSGEVARELNVR